MSKEEMIEWLKALRKCIDFYAIQKTEEDLTIVTMSVDTLIHEVITELQESNDLVSKQAVMDALLAKMDNVDKPDVVLGLACAMSVVKLMEGEQNE